MKNTFSRCAFQGDAIAPAGGLPWLALQIAAPARLRQRDKAWAPELELGETKVGTSMHAQQASRRAGPAAGARAVAAAAQLLAGMPVLERATVRAISQLAAGCAAQPGFKPLYDTLTHRSRGSSRVAYMRSQRARCEVQRARALRGVYVQPCAHTAQRSRRLAWPPGSPGRPQQLPLAGLNLS